MDLQPIDYEVSGRRYTGFLADGSGGGKAPGILVAHEGGGMTQHPMDRALMLAELGYVAFAMDTFGEPVTEMAVGQRIMRELMGDNAEFRARIYAALDVLKANPNVDSARVAAIGFCFGGTTVLELAKSGGEVACVVAFHPGLTSLSTAAPGALKARVLACVGVDDPIIPPDHRDAFIAEMNAAGADWQMLLLGGVGHSFTNPGIDALNLPGFKYDAAADRRSWAAMRDLFDETLGPVR
jgi:dienelactone hydrolase